MNREQAKELLPIIQAFADGEEIQCQDESGYWHKESTEDPHFDRPNKWRVKPLPEVIYVNKYTYGEKFYHDTEESARDCAKDSPRNGREHEYIAKPFTSED